MIYFFISGTSRGIGKALCDKALHNKAKVYGFSRTEVKQGSDYIHILMDFSDIENLYLYNFPVLEDTDKIVLINNAGTLGEVAPIGRITDDEILHVLQINSVAPGILMNKFIKRYENLSCEKIILNVSSGAGRHVIESWAAYCASKSALDMLSEVVNLEQQEYFKHPCKIFSVAPGIVDTAMQDEIRTVDEANFRDVERFKNYKTNDLLSSPEAVAKDLFKIIDNPQNYEQVVLDVRNL